MGIGTIEKQIEFSSEPRRTRFQLTLGRVLPFFLSGALFISGIFAVVSPLPLLYAAFRRKKKVAWAAALTNLIFVLLTSGLSAALVYFFGVAVLSLSLIEALTRKVRPERAVLITLLSIFGAAAIALAGYSILAGKGVVEVLSTQVNASLDYVIQTLPQESRQEWMGDLTPEAWKRSFVRELPSVFAVMAMILTWANLMMLLNLNPRGIRNRLGLEPDFFKRWKAPEYLLWPTIVSGFFLVFEVQGVSVVAINFFKFSMAVYAIQGLAILSALLDFWKVRGLFRSLAFIAVVFLMMPLLLGFGFFDTWFDFRGKLRQS